MKHRTARQSQNSELRLRIFLELAYGLLTFAVFAIFYRQDFFCNRTSSLGYVAPVLTLTIGVTLLDFIATMCGRVLAHYLAASIPKTLIASVVCSAIVGIVLFYLPFWVNQGYGHFRFESIANVGCLFTEGYGMMFLYLAPPFFALLSLIRELILGRMLRSRPSTQIS